MEAPSRHSRSNGRRLKSAIFSSASSGTIWNVSDKSEKAKQWRLCRFLICSPRPDRHFHNWRTNKLGPDNGIELQTRGTDVCLVAVWRLARQSQRAPFALEQPVCGSPAGKFQQKKCSRPANKWDWLQVA